MISLIKGSNIDFLNKPILEKGAVCYFMLAPISNPYCYIRFQGVVEKVMDWQEYYVYYVRVKKCLETQDFLETFCKYSQWQLVNNKTGRKPKKKVHYRYKSVKKFVDDVFKGHQVIIAPALIYDSLDDLHIYREKSFKYIQNHLRSNLLMAGTIINQYEKEREFIDNVSK